MLPKIEGIIIEESNDRLKVVLPIKRNRLLFGLFSIMLVIWAAMFIIALVFTIRDVAFSGERFAFVFTIMLLVFMVILYYLGRLVWKQWQYVAANREILFVDEETLIVRRPVSILGLTDAYDMKYVSPFYYSEKNSCPAFNYGHRHVYFGRDLLDGQINELLTMLNGRYFPDYDD
jgi:signal transduction histidine kinase